MFNLHAFFQNGDFAGADTYLNGVADQTTFVAGKELRVAPGVKVLLAELLSTVAATRNYARVESPSMRLIANQDIPYFSNSAANQPWNLASAHPYDPRPIETNESLQFLVNTDDAAAQDHFGMVWVGDGPMQPIDGPVITVRATATIQQVAGVWVAGDITFTQKLPVTDYQVVGMALQSASGVAGRLVLPGSVWRPGVVNNSSLSGDHVFAIRRGQWGVLGEFNINQPPKLEMLGGVAAAQVLFLDLIKIR